MKEDIKKLIEITERIALEARAFKGVKNDVCIALVQANFDIIKGVAVLEVIDEQYY